MNYSDRPRFRLEGLLLTRFLAVCALVMLAAPRADAQRLALDPLNRVHAGLAMVDGPEGMDIGLTFGMDSRLTRVIFVDVGGWVTPARLSSEFAIDEEAEPTSTLFLRHGIYATPGFRLPHRSKGEIRWDLIARGGFAAIWLTDIHPDSLVTGDTQYRMSTEPAGVIGIDAQARKDRVGARFTWRTLWGNPYIPAVGGYRPMQIDQYGVEVQVQFGGARS
jgi:hypothetical protein